MNNINWDGIIANLTSLEGETVSTDASRWNMENLEYSKIHNMWKEAQFNEAAMKWTNYYPGKHFSEDIVNAVASELNLVVFRSWISRVDPGFFAPWHWDVDDHEEEYLKVAPIVRYSCFITPPQMGHIFILGDAYYFKQPQGTLLRWNTYRDWHTGINAGLKPKFMFHIVGHLRNMQNT
jgi:hypothetical protein